MGEGQAVPLGQQEGVLAGDGQRVAVAVGDDKQRAGRSAHFEGLSPVGEGQAAAPGQQKSVIAGYGQ